MKIVRYYIYSMIITGLYFAITRSLSFIFGLFNIDSIDPWGSIFTAIVLVGLAIWYLDWNMRR